MHFPLQEILQYVTQYGPIALFVLLVLGIVGLPIPDETLMVFTGALMAKGKLDPLQTWIAGVTGSMSGITISYLIGRTAGHAFLAKFGPWLHLTPERQEKMHEWFKGYGHWSLTLGYFVPGVRHFSAVFAGMSELEWPVFARFAYSGSVLWVSTFLGLGYLLGDAWESAAENLHRTLGIIVLVVAAVGGLAFFIRRSYAGKR